MNSCEVKPVSPTLYFRRYKTMLLLRSCGSLPLSRISLPELTINFHHENLAFTSFSRDLMFGIFAHVIAHNHFD